MFYGVDNGVGAVALENVRKGVIVGRFARIAFGAVDLFEAFGGVAGEAVGSETDKGPCGAISCKWFCVYQAGCWREDGKG